MKAYGRLTKLEERCFKTLNYVIFKKNQFPNFHRSEIKLAEVHLNPYFVDRPSSSRGDENYMWALFNSCQRKRLRVTQASRD